jgi:hypothetical protein
MYNIRNKNIKALKRSLKTNPPIKGQAKQIIRIYEKYEDDKLVCRSLDKRILDEQPLQ